MRIFQSAIRRIAGAFGIDIRDGSHAAKITSSFSWLFFDNCSRLILGMVVGVWVARYLGAKDFGRLNYAQAIVAICAAVEPLGLAPLVVRDLVREPARHGILLATATAMRLAVGLISALVAVGSVWLLQGGDRIVHILVLITSVGTLVRGLRTIDLYFQARTEMRFVVIPNALSFITFSAAKVLLIVLGYSVIWFAVVMVLEQVVGYVVVLFLYLIRQSKKVHFRPQFGTARCLIRESWPLMVSGLSVTLYHRIGQVMLGTMLGQETLGYYSAAIRVSQLGYFLPSILATVIFPALVHSRTQGTDLYHTRVRQHMNVSAVFAYLIALPVSILASPIVRFLYGASYGSAAPILSVHIWSTLFVFLSVARGQYLVAEGYLRFSMYTTVAGLVVNLALNYLLIPAFGGVGCAWATVLSQAVTGVLSTFAFSRVRHVGRMQIAALASPVTYLLPLISGNPVKPFVEPRPPPDSGGKGEKL